MRSWGDRVYRYIPVVLKSKYPMQLTLHPCNRSIISVSLIIFSRVFSLVSFPRTCCKNYKLESVSVPTFEKGERALHTFGSVFTATSCPLRHVRQEKQRQERAETEKIENELTWIYVCPCVPKLTNFKTVRNIVEKQPSGLTATILPLQSSLVL